MHSHVQINVFYATDSTSELKEDLQWRKTMEYYIGLGGVSYFPIVQTLQELRNKTQAS